MAAPRDCVDLLQRMVRYDTVTPHQSGNLTAEQPLAECLAAWAEQWDLEVSLLPIPGYAPNLLITAPTTTSAPWLLFDSHLDTVSVSGMSVPPFEAQLRDGRVFGRGAADTKGTGAAMLWAMRETRRAQDHTANLALLFTVGEEHLQLGAHQFAERQLGQLGWQPTAAIVGEPTNMQIVVATNGLVRWTMRTRGLAAHSSAPQRGHCAIRDMLRVMNAVDQQYIAKLNASNPLTGSACCSMNVIRGGTQVNVIPDLCEVDVDRRIVPGEQAGDVLPAVQSAIDTVSHDTAQVQVELDGVAIVPPMDNELNRDLATTVASVLGDTDQSPLGAPYVTDGNRFAAAGIPTVVLGPGDIAQAHTHDEWIAVEQLEHGLAGYRAIMSAPAHLWQS